jgi:NDP-sugar pyrophosphorylase family protein
MVMRKLLLLWKHLLKVKEMKVYRKLNKEEIEILERQMCSASDWNLVEVTDGFSTDYVRYARFSGNVRLGAFRKVFQLAGGMVKHSGIYYATLHNVTVGDDCCIENVKNYIANYNIGDGAFIENVDIILVDGESSFGNGTKVQVLNETGGCEVMIFDRLTAQTAYVMALFKHRPELMAKMMKMIEAYVDTVKSSVGHIGRDVTIADAGYIKNVRIGDCCKIEGASRLKNGSINSNPHAPVHIGVGVVGDDFIISSGSSIEDGVSFSRCFIGQACRMGHTYSATDSLFFSNCQGENGEACAIFAGPFTVTHHKSTLLIAGMFSFMNAGSGSNQSNHLYKLGPIHHGIMERGSKTASDSYILWPAKVGAFSLVMGRHVCHQDTTDLPFSYLIEQQSTSYIMPGANLKSVGTIRDAKKWPARDARRDPDKLDCINYNLLSPYTIHKMLRGMDILKNLQKVSGDTSDSYTYQSGMIKRSSLKNGLRYYGLAVDKFLGNSLITRLMSSDFMGVSQMREALKPTAAYGEGDWMDLAGLIAPQKAVSDLLDAVERGTLNDVAELNHCFADLHSQYYDFEWNWAYRVIEEYYGVSLDSIEPEKLVELICRWRSSVVALDNLIYEDARKEFSLTGMSDFESDPFVKSVRAHIDAKTNLADHVLSRLSSIS